jgi:hypothetical protein
LIEAMLRRAVRQRTPKHLDGVLGEQERRRTLLYVRSNSGGALTSPAAMRLGNLVGSSLGDGRIDVFMIDFEKSRTLAGNPFMGSGNVDPRRLWPRDELGDILRRIRPATTPAAVLDRIRGISQQQISNSFCQWQQNCPLSDGRIVVLKYCLAERRILTGEWTRYGRRSAYRAVYRR